MDPVEFDETMREFLDGAFDCLDCTWPTDAEVHWVDVTIEGGRDGLLHVLAPISPDELALLQAQSNTALWRVSLYLCGQGMRNSEKEAKLAHCKILQRIFKNPNRCVQRLWAAAGKGITPDFYLAIDF